MRRPQAGARSGESLVNADIDRAEPIRAVYQARAAKWRPAGGSRTVDGARSDQRSARRASSCVSVRRHSFRFFFVTLAADVSA